LQRKLGVTTFFVTHDQVEALSMGDRVVVMQRGVVQQVGTPIELYEQPSNCFVASFIGSPSMNLLSGHTSAEGIAIAGERTVLKLSPSARQILTQRASPELRLGIRPEHIALSESPIADGCSLPATVEMVEALGYTTLIHARLRSDDRINVLMNGRARVSIGDAVYANFSSDHIYLFDAQNEAALHGISLR
jgi:ABC-type sugar transport system ATPase subunit